MSITFAGKLLFVICLFASIVAGLPAYAAEIVALGASNTHGRGKGRHADGVERPHAFPAQLERLLRSQGCRARVANAGVAGDTTGGMLARLPRAIQADTKVVILQPGGNDRRQGQGQDRAGNIQDIEQKLAARGIKTIMLDRLNQIAGSYLLPDGQHYSAEGHAAFAAHLAPHVKAAGAC